MKLYLLQNQSRFSSVLEDFSPLQPNGEGAKIERFVSGTPAPELDEPLQVRLHFRSRRPLPPPDFCRGSYLSFVSTLGKTLIEEDFGDWVQFVPVRMVGLGIEKGAGRDEAGFEASPFAEIPDYHVMHAHRTADLLDEERSMVLKSSIGELPELLPMGQFQRMAFRSDAAIPPLFSLPFHTNFPVASEEFVSILNRKKLKGLHAVPFLDTTDGQALSSSSEEVVSLAQARRLASELTDCG